MSTRGFTLLEVTIALIIAALAGAALLRAAGAGLQATTNAALYDQALVRAKSHLAEATGGAPLRPGDFQGDDGGGFHWRLRVEQVASGAARPSGLIGPRAQTSLALALFRVTAAISWHEGEAVKIVSLTTEQMGGS